MYIMKILAAATITSMPSLVAIPPSVTLIGARGVEQRIVGGSWTGKFLQNDWTFRFTNENGNLQGEFTTSSGGKWQPISRVTISDGSILLAIDSKPKVNFSLELDAADRNMSGHVSLDGFGTVPFSAMRIP